MAHSLIWAALNLVGQHPKYHQAMNGLPTLCRYSFRRPCSIHGDNTSWQGYDLVWQDMHATMEDRTSRPLKSSVRQMGIYFLSNFSFIALAYFLLLAAERKDQKENEDKPEKAAQTYKLRQTEIWI